MIFLIWHKVWMNDSNESFIHANFVHCRNFSPEFHTLVGTGGGGGGRDLSPQWRPKPV